MASTAPMRVRFPDGTIRYGHYNATSDCCGACLHGSPVSGRDHNWFPPVHAGERHEVQSVRIAVDYGGGYSWGGTATLDRLLTGFDPWGQGDVIPAADNYEDGLPVWWGD